MSKCWGRKRKTGRNEIVGDSLISQCYCPMMKLDVIFWFKRIHHGFVLILYILSICINVFRTYMAFILYCIHILYLFRIMYLVFRIPIRISFHILTIVLTNVSTSINYCSLMYHSICQHQLIIATCNNASNNILLIYKSQFFDYCA